MADSNASGAPRKRAKVSGQSPTRGEKTDVRTSEGASFRAAQKELGREKNQATEGDNTEEYAPSAQVWNTTELLENIISYLPGKSIVVVSGVNKMAYNCVNYSYVAQSKLFVRPSGREQETWLYCEFFLPYGSLPRHYRPFPSERKIIAQSFEPSMDAFCEIERSGEVVGEPNWVSVVALCPLLELEDIQESTALGRLKRQGWQEEERVRLVGLPAENTKYADMILTDPPTNEVDAELTYKHTLNPLLMIRVRRYIASSVSPLTVGAVLKRACSERGRTYLHEPAMPSNDYLASHRVMPRSTANDVILEVLQEHGGSFTLDLTESRFVFHNRHFSLSGIAVNRIVVLSAEERLDMDASRVQ